jgi:hypothetical protein
MEGDADDYWFPSIAKVAIWLQRWNIDHITTLYALFGLYFTSLLMMLLGIGTRVFSFMAWLLHSATIGSGYLSLYGVDTMLHIFLFYSIFIPLPPKPAWRLFNGTMPAVYSFGGWAALYALRVHLCLIYINTAMAKIQGTQWWNGEAIWRALMQPQFSVLDFSWLAENAWLAKLICWVTMLVEAGYAFFIWPYATRRFWLWGILLLHLGIALFMGLWIFSITMIMFNICAFGFSVNGEFVLMRTKNVK